MIDHTFTLADGTTLVVSLDKTGRDSILAALALGKVVTVQMATVHAVIFPNQIVSISWAVL
ncbi:MULTISPECIES: hypothetical protein [Glycomyces]|uniref:Uncharacterized protein n=2 Tax=Glycomyces TaxID=58113 RepID=A0A9X3T9D3_9ACTN|nr:hypothetical protein [Glycomyces lechevalierae]MDA1386353.1 hypothetical protein [Glycomyces lechevalierae]MDR7338868.1 hypothetical protein [Glycomyces lechevalierae]